MAFDVNGAAEAGAGVVLLGANFFATDGSPSGDVSGACVTTAWTSATSAACDAGAGVGGSYSVILTVTGVPTGSAYTVSTEGSAEDVSGRSLARQSQIQLCRYNFRDDSIVSGKAGAGDA